MKDNRFSLIGSGTAANAPREDRDYYPTPLNVTVALLDFLDLDPCNILEPACGEYAISNVCQVYGHKVVSTDILYGENYLGNYFEGFDAIITNPPFKLAEDFIRKAVDESPIVAMLLKSTYWHTQKRKKLFTDTPPAYILPLLWRPNFYGNKATGSGPMDFIWTVWISGKTDTRFRLLDRPKDSRTAEIKEKVNQLIYPDLY